MRVTHGVTATAIDGEVKREINVMLFDEGSYGVTFTTFWKPDEEPAVTRVKLSKAGFMLLTDCLLEACHNMHKYEIEAEAA